MEWWKKQTKWQKAEHVVVAAAASGAAVYVWKRGLKGVLGDVVDSAVAAVPGASAAVDAGLEKEVEETLKMLFGDRPGDSADLSVQTQLQAIPAQGRSRAQVLEQMKALRKGRDLDASEGTVFALIYTNPDGEHYKFIHEVHAMFMNENALNPMAFPSLRKFENEVVRMALTLLGGDARSVGNLTSGGTESLLLAVKTWRDHECARKGIRSPEIILPSTAHPAFRKGAHYFGLTVREVPVRADFSADVAAMRALLNRNTVLLVASAPSYPHGVMDDVVAIGQLGREHDVPVHVDACMGGFILPWAQRLGRAISPFDFSVAGVMSISADLHKYGFTPKGASVLLYRTAESRKAQFFAQPVWSGGMYISPTMLGTRGGGSIAAAWATMVTLGEEGYLALAKSCLDTADFFRERIPRIRPLCILGDSRSSLLAFGSADSSRVSIMVVADIMEERFGWHLDRQNHPDSIHLTVMPPNESTRQKFVDDLAESVREIEQNPGKWGGKGSKAAMYGLVASTPSSNLIERFLLTLMDKMYF